MPIWRSDWYEAHLDNDLLKREIDHAFAGRFDGKMQPTTGEVEDIPSSPCNSQESSIKESEEDTTCLFETYPETISESSHLH